MLTYQSNIAYTSNNNLIVNPNNKVAHSPNKRGCCQTKRRNYGLLTSSNGISSSTEKTCCSKEKQSGNSNEKSSCSKCNQSNVSSRKVPSSMAEPTKNKYSEAKINSFKNEFDKLVSNGTIRLNEFLEIIEKGSTNSFSQYSEKEVKAKLLNSNLKLDVVSRINENTNSININIIDVNKQKKYLDQTLNFKKSETNLKKYEESVSIIILARWLAIQNLYAKRSKSHSKTQGDKPPPPSPPPPTVLEESECKEKYGVDGVCMCINHDMGCSSITAKSGNFQFWTICAGFFETDVFECCYNHDIGLWCTSGLDTAAELGFNLIACFEEKIIKQYSKEAGWFCEFFELPILFTSILLLPLILSPIIGIGMDIFSDADLRNVEGQYDDSCLCGGNVPTFCCGGFDGVCKDECCNKVELCSSKVDKKRGEGCVEKNDCGEICSYYVSPNAYNPNIMKLSSYVIMPGRKQYYSKKDPSKMLDKSECCSTNLPNCTEKCFNCYYTCKKNPATGKFYWANGKILIDSTYLGSSWENVPCCPGTPNEDLNNRSNYCDASLNNTGGGGLPPCGSKMAYLRGGPCEEVNRKDNNNIKISDFTVAVIT